MRNLAFLFAATAALLSAQGSKTYPSQARSMVVSKGGIVASSQVLASQAGAMVLDRGGSAIDAAIAANAVLGVTEPMWNGIGGDLMAIVWDAKAKKLYGLNATGWAPKGQSLAYLKTKGITGRPPNHSIQYVTVPGAVAGWDALRQKFGKLSFADDLAPAIYYADQGFPVAERTATLWDGDARRSAEVPGFKDAFMIGGHAPALGQVFQMKDYAKSLRFIADHGRDGFYKGATAKALLAFSTDQGGTMTQEDLEQFQPEWVEPISTTYHGWTVWELPPPGQGVAALSMLNIMEQFPLAQYGQNSTKALHVMIEAKKLAYADLTKYVGDPHFNDLPTKELISKELAVKRAKLIDQQKASCKVMPSDLQMKLSEVGNDTTYLTAVDKDGNIISLIQSLYSEFGTGLVVPGTGIALHNRGGLFEFEPGNVNTIGPRKRPQTTIIPAFMEKGDVKIGFGIMGGYNQAQAHAQFVSDIADFNFDIQAAMEAPRFTKGSFDGCDVSIESRVPESVQHELTALGHQLRVAEPYSGQMGRGNVVEVDGNGVKFGGSDPRADGAAIPQSPPVSFSSRR